MSEAAKTAPTSELPFAARHCDVPYFDRIKYYRTEQVQKMEGHVTADASTSVQYAWSMASVGDRMSQISDLLELADTLFEKAHLGAAADMSPAASFEKALRLLGLSRELLDGAGLDADKALEELCELVAAAPVAPAKTKAGTPAT